MGKRYYCDYCDKTMVSAPSIVKIHNKGMVHQKLVSDHYQQYKDAETILLEESSKRPCIRFPRGECNFGSICRYSHYSKEEIAMLQEYVANKKKSKMDVPQTSFEDLYQKFQDDKLNKPPNADEESTTMYDENGVTYVFPWTYNSVLDSYGENLPPSIKRIKLEHFSNVKFADWG